MNTNHANHIGYTSLSAWGLHWRGGEDNRAFLTAYTKTYTGSYHVGSEQTFLLLQRIDREGNVHYWTCKTGVVQVHAGQELGDGQRDAVSTRSKSLKELLEAWLKVNGFDPVPAQVSHHKDLQLLEAGLPDELATYDRAKDVFVAKGGVI